MTYHLGVDVGTTYTAAAAGRDGRVEPVTLGTRSVSAPTVVCLADDRLLVGEAAARRAVTDPLRVAREFKRRVGDPTPLLLGGSPVSAELCMARVVEWVVAQVSATEGGPPASLALTHPANWGEYKLDLLRQALRHVGVPVDRFVPEPVAAAVAYAAQRPLAPGTTVAVYDLGGGTFDAAVVRAGTAGPQIVGRPDGIERLGGVDFDHAVLRHVLSAIGRDLDQLGDGAAGDGAVAAAALARLRAECVEAKEALSHETSVSIPVMLPSLHTEVSLTRGELEAMIRPALGETLVALRRAVASAAVPVGDLAAVLLVGGSSRIPLVGQIVAAELGRPVAVDARPKDAISTGAARAAMAAFRPPPAPPVSGPPLRGEQPRPVPTPEASAAAGRPGAGPGRRILTGVLAAAVVVLAVAVTLVAIRGGDPQSAGGDTTTTSSVPDEVTTSSPGSPPSTAASGGDATPAPLPGDDWNDAARAQFVDDCGTGIAGTVGAVGADPAELCGCIYDDAAASRDFTAFNEMWSSEDFDPASDEGRYLTGVIVSCTMSSAEA